MKDVKGVFEKLISLKSKERFTHYRTGSKTDLLLQVINKKNQFV